MPDPELLLLDEPAAAVNPTMINQMKDHILALHREGKTGRCSSSTTWTS